MRTVPTNALLVPMAATACARRWRSMATVSGLTSCDEKEAKPRAAGSDLENSLAEVSSNAFAAGLKRRRLGDFCRPNYLSEFSGI